MEVYKRDIMEMEWEGKTLHLPITIHAHRIEDIYVYARGCGIVEFACRKCGEYWFDEDGVIAK